ncbi:MAG: Gfo/Idh/MocA family protein [Tepidisphaeraceae bacterium]
MPQLALVGCAHIHTPDFIRMLQGRSDVRVASVWDHDRARAEKRAGELGARVVDNVRAVCDDKEIAGAIVSSETDRHEQLVAPLAGAGKHLFIEKPLGFASRDARAMADVIEHAGIIFQTGYFMRGMPHHLFLREQVRAGAFGRITRLRGSSCHSGSLGGWFDTEWRWMADPKIAGCGAYGDLGTHSLDILLWLIDEPVVSATGAMDVATARYGKECEEYGEGIMRFKNGAVATLAAGWVDVANPISLLISGTEGHAAVVNGQLYFTSKKVEGADGKQPWTNLPPGRPHAFELFLDAVAGKKDVELVGVREAAYRNTVMEAIYEGARQQKWVAPA